MWQKVTKKKKPVKIWNKQREKLKGKNKRMKKSRKDSENEFVKKYVPVGINSRIFSCCKATCLVNWMVLASWYLQILHLVPLSTYESNIFDWKCSTICWVKGIRASKPFLQTQHFQGNSVVSSVKWNKNKNWTKKKLKKIEFSRFFVNFGNLPFVASIGSSLILVVNIKSLSCSGRKSLSFWWVPKKSINYKKVQKIAKNAKMLTKKNCRNW